MLGSIAQPEVEGAFVDNGRNPALRQFAVNKEVSLGILYGVLFVNEADEERFFTVLLFFSEISIFSRVARPAPRSRTCRHGAN